MKVYYNLKKSVMWDCRLLLLFRQWHFVHFLYLWIFFFFFFFFCIFSLSSWKSNQHVFQRSPHMQRYMDSWNWWKSSCANRTKQPLNSKYTACIRKSGKLVDHLKKEATGRFAKTIFFFLKGDSYLEAKTITSGQSCNPGDGGDLQVPCKLKLVGHKKFIDLLLD